jgi:hypothetical protein
VEGGHPVGRGGRRRSRPPAGGLDMARVCCFWVGDRVSARVVDAGGSATGPSYAAVRFRTPPAGPPTSGGRRPCCSPRTSRSG